jgi:hypothetical protein
MHSAHQDIGGFGNITKRGGIGLIVIWLMLLISIPAIAVASHDDDHDHNNDHALFGPKKYVRIQGKPSTWTSTFTACSSPARATLKLTNGSGSKSRVSSAVVTLNGGKVIAEIDLNQKVPSLSRSVTLKAGLNSITVTIKSGSGNGDDDHHDGNDNKDREHGDHNEHHNGDEDGHDDNDNHSRDHTATFLTLQISGKACGSSDTTHPVISNPQPADGALLAVVRPAISVAFADNSGGSGIDSASVRVTLDGSDITTMCSVTTTGAVCNPAGNLNDGMHSVTVALADLTKNPASYTWRFTIDTTPPQITVTSPQNGQSLGNPLVMVTGTVDDPAATITVTSTLLGTGNSKTAKLSGQSFSAAAVPLTEGANSITIIARDPLGNQSTTTLNVTLDTTLPVVTITAPADANFTNVPTVTVSGQVSEAPAGVTVNGRPATITGQTYSLENLPLTEGQNTITALAQDPVGNKGSAVTTVTLDTVTPQIFVTTPADGLLTRNPQLNVSGTISETVASLSITSTSLSASASIPVNGQAFSIPLTLVEGANTITLEASDRAGNKGIARISVTLDSTPPIVPVLEALTSPTNNPIVTVKGSAEPGSSVALSAGGVQIANSMADTAGLLRFSNITLTEGETLFTAQATDSAGNAGQPSAPLAVILDTVAPSVAISTPLDGTNLNTPVITISGSIDDPAALVTVNGLPAINSGGVWMLVGFTLQEGTNTLLVEARDPAGNKGSTSATVVLDTIPPVVAITAPVDGLYTNIVQVTVSGTVNEEVTSVTVNGTSATLNAGSTPVANTTFTTTLTLVEGINSIVVTAVDKAGNTGTATINVTLDTIAPQIAVIGPADGALLNNGQITFGGSAAEPVTQVTVNGIAAQAGSNGGYTLPVTLVEGSNTLIVTATDRAGNRSTSTITVNLDSIAPSAPLLNPIVTPTRFATTTVSGQAEANSTVKLFNNGVLIATLTADSAGLLTVANIILTEGNNAFTAEAVDKAGNSSPASAPLTVTLDTKAPVITVTAPQAGALVNTAQVTITGTVDEPLASLAVNGGTATLNGNTFEYAMTLAAGDNSALITATDLAGNVSTTTITIQRDSTPPKVAITTPLNGLLTNNPQVQVSGTVDDAEATVTIGGAAVTLVNKAFSVGYVLTDGENNIQVNVMDKAGNAANAGVTVSLDAQSPVVTLNAPATATAGTDVQVSVNAMDNRGLTLVDVSADGASLWSAAPNAATASQSVSLRLSPTLTPGAIVTVRGRALDAAGNSGSATTVITIDKGADGPGWLQGKVLDDNRGLPLAGVQVSVTDAKGVQQSITTTADGAWFFELASGAANVEVTKSGFTAVRRDVTVRSGQRTSVLDSRLTRIDGTARLIDAVGGSVRVDVGTGTNRAGASRPYIEMNIPANNLSVSSDVRLTPVSNQGLIAPLPLGWSPLAVADLRLIDPVTAAPIDPQPLTASVTLTLPLPAGLGDTALTAELARYDSSSRRWLAVAEIAVAAKATNAAAQITQPSQYALLLADPAPLNPPVPATGQELVAVTLQPSDFSLISANGRVVPQAVPPSVGLRAAGDLLLVAKPDAAAAPAMISGLVVNARVSEKFDLTGGSTLQPAATVQDIVLYRTPCATSITGGATEPPFDSAQGPALRTTFPVSPSRDFTIVDLLLGKISIEITQPDTSGGVMVGADGARLLQPDGTSLSIPAGSLTGTVPVTVTTLPEATVSSLIGADFRLLRGVDIAITGQTLKNSATLSIPAPAGFDPALPVVVARKFDVKGGSKLKLVAAAKLSGSIINSEPFGAEIWAGAPRPYIDSSGIYCFLQAVAPIGYVAGQITDAATAAFPAIQVTAQSATLADLTGVNGQYLLALAAGSQTVTALDPARGDVASGTIAIAANSKSSLNLTVAMTPPTVVSISPTNGAANVQPSVPVVVTFSKQMDKNSINSQTLKLTDSSNSEVVPGVITFNVDNTVVTFYPSDAFKQETTYNVTVASAAKDVQGYSMGQDVVSNFTVRKTTPPVMPPAGSISGTFPDADGFITVTATQGTAPADCTVLLINDTSGEIQSVTSQSNGSFTGKVRGQLGDEIKVVLMDNSGNQTTISYLTFKNSDGSYLVTAKGGKIEGDSGSILDIPEGALVGPTVIKITTLQESNLPTPLQTPGKYLGAVNIDTGGISFQKAVEISIPLPDGFNTNDAVFITKPSTLVNSDDTTEQVYEIIDSTKIIGNRITSACDPFPGVWAGGSLIFTHFPELTPIVVSGYTYQDRNDLPSFQPAPEGVVETPTKDAAGNLVYKYDRPIQGAVIRSPDAWNYVSYTNIKGFYGTFASMAVLPAGLAGPDANCKRYRITAVNPQTMFKGNFDGYACAPPYNVRDVNFKLADKGTVPPDKTKPTIEAIIKVDPSMSSGYRIVSGTVPVNTKLVFPVSVTDEDLRSTSLVVNFKGDDGAAGTTPVTLVRPPTSMVVRSITRGIDVPVYRTDFITQFNSDPTKNYFLADQPGVYTFVVEAKDSSGNFDSLLRSIRVISSGGVLPTGREGAPTVDAVSPLILSKNISVNSPVVATFSEPVGNVTENTFQLLDLSAVPATSNPVPATVSVTLAGNRTVATLTPKSNLWFGHTYKVILTTGIKDENVNTTAPSPYAPPDGDGRMPLAQQYESTFTTVMPDQHDLGADEQFSGGRDIDLYEFTTSSGDQKTYAYVAAGDNGWRAVDVSDPSTPLVLSSKSFSSAGVAWAYRGVSVNPDTKILGMTDSSTYSDGNQYGYVRFYDLNANPEAPQIVGREKLAEAYSGIPGRLALFGDYAYIATTVAGVQVVDVNAAIERQKQGAVADGSTIVSAFDSMGQGYGSPNDVAVFNAQKALVTTNNGYLLPLDITAPYYPILMTAYRPANTSFIRAAIAPEYEYTDENGLDNKIDLAVAATRDGRLVTIDMTDAYNPGIMGTATNDVSSPITTAAMDISIVKTEKLAFVTTLAKIKVFDIKDPRNPKLRNEFQPAADPAATTPPAAIGQTPAIIAREGWIYMANMRQGLRTMGVNTNDIKVYNENKIQVFEIGYSKGIQPERRYYVEVKFNDPEIICDNSDLEGKMVIKTRSGGAVNPLAGIDHPTQYQLSFRKGTDGLCYADLKNMTTSTVKDLFIATNFPASDPTLTTALTTVAPVFGSIGTKAIFEFSNRNDGRLMKRKSVDLEKLIRIAFDGNRDGKIKFDDPEDRKYTFWVNEDHDVEYVTANLSGGTTSEYDDMLNTMVSDADDDVTNSLRDLEDFAPLHVQMDKHARQVIKRLQDPAAPLPKFTYHLQLKNTNGANPSINLFEAVGDETMQYLEDLKTAENQIAKKKTVTVDAANEANLLTATLKDEDVTKFIFEGKTNGIGDLTITLKSDGVFVDDNAVKLDLKPISWFYDKYQATYDDASKSVLPAYTTRKAEYQPRDNDYVFYVHGWNMSSGEDEKERWAETMFKRLWWQGYSGRVGLFSWPTLEGGLTFDESEFRAWNSSEAFKNVLLSSDMQKYQGKIRILGHSMGGIVSGETINKLPGPGIVKSYIATQAALSSHFFDNTQNETSWASATNIVSTPNVYGYYFSGTATSSNKPYLINSLKKAEFINYYNENDYALTAGALGYFGWEMNNMTKPDSAFGYGYEKSLNQYFHQPLLSVRELVFEADRYEIFSRITQSRVKALGATTHAIDGFTSNMNKDLSLLKYNGEHYSHSKQFRSTITDEWGYWSNVMTDFELSKY